MPSTSLLKPVSQEEQLERMRRDWDRRARRNARYFVSTGRHDAQHFLGRIASLISRWSDKDFFASGEKAVAEDILTDTTNINQGKDPAKMRVLEIGCGAGRLTNALSKVFGEVHAVDVSGEMIARAKSALRDRSNVYLYQNNGRDLSVLPQVEFDFAYSNIVFQHIPSREIIESYVSEVHRLLRPGALFKFQVQGDVTVTSSPEQTWVGVPFSDDDVVAMAQRNGFEPRYRHGAGTQYFWLWYFKNPA
jgi:SAM-dependent methyltransferase